MKKQYHKMAIQLPVMFLFLSCIGLCTGLQGQETIPSNKPIQQPNNGPISSPQFSLKEYWQDQTEANLRWILLRRRAPLGRKKLEDRVVVFADRGVWSEGAQRVVFQMEAAKRDCLVLSGPEFGELVNNKENRSPKTTAVIIPGGNAFLQHLALGKKSKKDIQTYVAGGGFYVGICAGAYLGSQEIVWQDKSYPYGLGLFPGSAVGDIPSIAPCNGATSLSPSVWSYSP